jgi:hypothetical protein
VPPRVVQNPRAALKPKLSGPVVDLSSGDGGSGLVSTAASAPPGEVRVSIDYNQTSNVNGPGQAQLSHFSEEATSSILDFLLHSPRNCVGVCV